MRRTVLLRTWNRPARLSRTRCHPEVQQLESRSLLAGGPGAYGYQALATLGEPAPAGAGFLINDFEPGGINNRGDALFGADLGTTTDSSSFYGEGVFLLSKRQDSLLVRATEAAPGGGTFDFLLLGPTALNDRGDAAIDFTLSPFGSPVGVNSGVYRYSHDSRTVTAVVVPGVTPAPGGDIFAGAFFGPSLNNRGDLVFPGIVPTDQGIHVPNEDYIGLGVGIFRADKRSVISSVVSPGDPAPGGGTFDFASSPWVNDKGDVAFVGHVAGEPVVSSSSSPQAFIINALGSVYVKDAATGEIRSIAHAGQPAPGGGVFRQASGPVMNNRGEIVFSGDLTPAPDANAKIGVFLYSGGEITAIARPGDLMPGGGHLVTASSLGGTQIHINNRGEIVFNAVLDTDDNKDGIPDTGLFEWSHGDLSLVARTGTVIPGVGTVDSLVMGVIVVPPPPVPVPNSGAVNNDRGQVLFGATLEDGQGVLLVATPTGPGHAAATSAATGRARTGERAARSRDDAPTPGDTEVPLAVASSLSTFSSSILASAVKPSKRRSILLHDLALERLMTSTNDHLI
jgi:hypothetical protein